MKTWYDQKAKHRVFSSGHQVLVLLPIPGSVLQAQYSGPYITESVGECNYLVKAPDRKRKTCMCHVNLLKPYIERNQTVCAEVKALAVLNVSSTETEVLLTLGLLRVDCQILKFWLIWILICLI